MSEFGPVPFARVALEVSQEVVPVYSHRFSPQRFTQPRLLAILCLMRYEDWTFRAAEFRLAEHAELSRWNYKLCPITALVSFYAASRISDPQALAEVVRRFKAARLPLTKPKAPWR